MYDGKTCKESSIRIAGGIDAVVLRADPAALAISLATQIYALFQWADPSEQMLRDDLEKLYTRRL